MDLAGNITICQNVFEGHLTSFHFTTLTTVSVAKGFSINYLDMEFIFIRLVKHKRLLSLFGLLKKSFLEVLHPRSHLEYDQAVLEMKEKGKLKYCMVLQVITGNVLSWKRSQIKHLGKYSTAASTKSISAFHIITELKRSSYSTQESLSAVLMTLKRVYRLH